METETSLLATNTIDADQIEYASHVHPLTLCEIDDTNCSLCRERCLGLRTYGCNQCGLFLHESCTKIQIPQEIDHFFHPHPLRLAMNESKLLDSYCDDDDSLPCLMFECRDCEFYIDVECALLPTKLKQDGCIDHIQHLDHPHPLILCDDEEIIKNDSCCRCGGELSTNPCFSYDTSLLSKGSESIYGCLQLRCGFFLHELCARLPQKIDSPIHPGHSLQLSLSKSSTYRGIISYDDDDDDDDEIICRGCKRNIVDCYTYKCGSCNFTNSKYEEFVLCVQCAFLPAPILKVESHKHLLMLFPSVSPFLLCEICNKKCDSSNIFRCIHCDYNLHLHCGPLPCSIKDKCHVDPLKLMYAFVEDGYEDDIVYCDACEQPRDPDECVYYCKDCNFITEVKCVAAEVLCSLNGERGNVKLRTANKSRIQVGAKLISNIITGNVETNSDDETDDIGAKYLEVKLHENLFSGSYTDEEYDQIIEFFKKAGVNFRPSPWINLESSSILNDSNKAFFARIELAELQSERKQEFENSLFCYSSDEESDNGENSIVRLLRDGFKQLMRDLDSYYEDDELLDYFFFCRDYNIVRIGDHKIEQKSASVLKGLLHKYDDFTAKSKLSERLKAMYLTMFCQVILKMCLTNVREVNKKELHIWVKALKLVQLVGFEIQFAIDQLYKVVQAFYGMQAISGYNKSKWRVDKKSRKIEKEEAELEAKMRKLEAKKRGLEAKKIHLEEEKSQV